MGFEQSSYLPNGRKGSIERIHGDTAFELVTERVAALSVCSVITPPETVEGVEVPVSASILESSVWTLSVTLIWCAPEAPEATKVRV